ncbi:MAG: 7,8-didemethyl-8-hydroxy-5-deazariboflavin synthase CofG, partial [Vicinamibacteria bacterium]
LCRDRCGYCTFRREPTDENLHTMTPEQVREQARSARRAGCTEALFCLGDKPEAAYPAYREWLRSLGFRATHEYVAHACRIALEEGLLPHTNAGILGLRELALLKRANASMGLMLESVSERLHAPGGAHHNCPDKLPVRRLKMHADAGALAIPFTSGILIGIGETREERIEAFLALASLQRRYGHIQEVIVQNFNPKPGIAMERVPPPSGDEVAWTVAVARLVLGPEMNIQAPPNLNPTRGARLLAAGANDWGGVSPLTIDYVNPEAPWPAVRALEEMTRACGFELRERLAIYPEYVRRPGFLDESLRHNVESRVDQEGFVAGEPKWREHHSTRRPTEGSISIS